MAIHQQELYDKIFWQIPCLLFASMNAPYIGKGYGSDANCRILVVHCSAYGPSEAAARDLSISDFYKVQPARGEGLSYPAYSSEDIYTLHADYNPVKSNRKKIEQAVASISPGKTLEDVAHYHFILRLLRASESPSSTDLDYAIEAFPKIIDILKPTHVLFFGNDCLRTVSRRAFTKPVENKSIERFLTDKGIFFSTISRRAGFQEKTSAVPNQKQMNDLLDQIEERAARINETSILSSVDMLRKLINSDDADRNAEDAGIGQKTDFIIDRALKNQKSFSTTTFRELAEQLNRLGFRTARGESFSAEGNGPLLLVNRVFRKALGQGDYDAAVAIAATFINDRTGLPWILNETIEKYVKAGAILFEDGVLRIPVTDMPITEENIPSSLVEKAFIKDVDEKFRDMLVEYLEKKQEHIRGM